MWTAGARFQVLFNLATCSNQLLDNKLCQDSSKYSIFYEKVNKGQLKIVNVPLLKISVYCFESPVASQKHVRNVCHRGL